MDQAVTVGEVLGFVLVIGAGVFVCGILLWILSLFADAWKH